jgi:hypothetical protein
VIGDANGVVPFSGNPAQCVGNGWNISVIWATDPNYKTIAHCSAAQSGATVVVVTAVDGFNNCPSAPSTSPTDPPQPQGKPT